MKPLLVDEKNMPATAEATAELFDDIDPSYFVADGFNATAYELNKIAGRLDFDLDYLERECFRLKRQAQIVSKKVSGLIMQNSLGFSGQVKHYSSVQVDANEILQDILKLRGTLATRRWECRTALSVVANHRKRRYLEYLKSVLQTLQSLVNVQSQLKNLINLGDYLTALQLCVKTITDAEAYSHLHCVRDLSCSLTKTLESLEFYMDDALAVQTVNFAIDRYALLQSAYEILGRSERAAQKQQRFFRETIDGAARTALADGLRKASAAVASKIDLLSYEEMCQATSVDGIVLTCKTLLTGLYEVLCSYHALLRFHIEEDERRLATTSTTVLSPTHSHDPATVSAKVMLAMDIPLIEKGVFQKALMDNLYAVFKYAALKYNTLLCCCDLATLKFDQFIEVVEMANRFRKFGRKHFGNHCVEVALTLEKQSLAYFQRYHAERMDELKMFLESEAFALCLVSVQFTLFDLPEFHFLKEASDSLDDDSFGGGDKRLSQILTDHLEIGEQLDFTLINRSVLTLFPQPPIGDELGAAAPTDNGDIRIVHSPVPFQANGTVEAAEVDKGTSMMACSSSEESVYGDDATRQDSMLNVCNTALNVLRFFGRYIRMTSILRSISEPAISSIVQLYKYFFYTEVGQSELDFSTGRLRNLTNVIRSELISLNLAATDSTPIHQATTNGSSHSSSTVDEPVRVVSVDDATRIFALAERIVGVESLIFLSKQLELLRPVLESLTRKRSKVLDDFYKSTLPVTLDVRRCAYGAAMSRVFDYNDLVRRVTAVKWDVHDIQSEHNAYVDFVVTHCATVKDRLLDVCTVAHVSRPLNAQLWSILLECIFRALVQGSAEASKKCSNEGRALMLLDFESLSGSLEALTSLRPLPQKSYLENYIKAFYLPQDELAEWIIHHTEYTVSEVTALLNTCSGTAKKSKFSTFMNLLESRDLIP